MLFIHPGECIDCGGCIPECPVEAIFIDDDVPDEWREFIDLNAEMAPKSPNILQRKAPLAKN